MPGLIILRYTFSIINNRNGAPNRSGSFSHQSRYIGLQKMSILLFETHIYFEKPFVQGLYLINDLNLYYFENIVSIKDEK